MVLNLQESAGIRPARDWLARSTLLALQCRRKWISMQSLCRFISKGKMGRESTALWVRIWGKATSPNNSKSLRPPSGSQGTKVPIMVTLGASGALVAGPRYPSGLTYAQLTQHHPAADDRAPWCDGRFLLALVKCWTSQALEAHADRSQF